MPAVLAAHVPRAQGAEPNIIKPIAHPVATSTPIDWLALRLALRARVFGTASIQMLVNPGNPTDAQRDGELLDHGASDWVRLDHSELHQGDGVHWQRLPAAAATTHQQRSSSHSNGQCVPVIRVRRADGVAVIGVAIQTNRFETTG